MPASGYASGPAYPSRPIGVAILSVLIGFFGFLLLLVGVLIVLLVAVPYFVTGVAVFGATAIGGLLLLVFGIVLLAVAVGLWRLELWALILSILVVLLLWLSDVLTGRFFTVGGIVLLLLLVYLAAVNGHFR